MKPGRTLAIAAVAVSARAAALAQNYPARPIRLILGFAPGGSTDLVARVVGQKMAEAWGQQVVIDNRPGANGMIGADLVAKASPDGYSLLLSSIGPMAINASLYKMPYDIVADFAPVTYTGNVTNLLVVHPSVPATNVKELIALAKAQPGKLTFGSSGTGGAPHMAVELFKILANVNVVHVPYKGGGPAMADLVGGQISGQLREHAVVDSVRAGGQAARARSHRAQALAGGTPGADDFGGGDPGILRARLAGLVHHRKNAAGDRQQAECRSGAYTCAARRDRKAGGRRGRNPDQHAQRVGRFCKIRNREMGESRQGRAYQGRIAGAAAGAR